ncbi:outer membrane beta-barrel family protein [Chryseosolibacter indicus]|uniref:TonB-dependent receptor n=1 Tax=Chryseosolibacter indicus TaxID=2782351 RepID=A0ABS5VYU5_9BACT|nr:outer membrane beta-barrel family protein [Chryseosolibacter indicus]MBT1706491.1 TonB-dependent receptor [Chryseosolibacter indicus]
MQVFTQPANALLLFFFLLTVTAARSQNSYTVTGNVTSRDGTALMGNAIALSPRDSSVLQGVSFLEGNFELKDLPYEVIIKLTSIQFADTVFSIQFAASKRIDLGKLKVKDHLQLNEIEITGELPLFATRADGVVQVNVANTVLANSSSLTEILTRAPGVTSDENGLSVFGKGQAILYLNGKRITAERLNAISAAQVKNIEIISNPPASFDAEGQAVINIVTHTPTEDGYRVTLNQQFSWSNFADGLVTHTLLNGSFKKGRLDVIGNVDRKLGKERELLNTTRTRNIADDYLNSKLRWDAHRDFTNVSNYSLGASYSLSNHSYLSLEYNGFSEHVDEIWQSENYITTSSDDGIYTSNTNRDGLIKNNAVTLNSQTSLDSLGSSLFVGGQFSRYNSGQDDAIAEYNTVDDEATRRPLQSLQDGTITIYSPQADLVKVLKNGAKLGIGAKLSHANVSSQLMFYNKESDTPVVDSERSNKFSYEENIPAVYAQYEYTANATTFGIGLRSEWTSYTLRTSIGELDKYQSQYIHLFPQAQVSFSVSPQLKLRANYTSRIKRPRYQALSPTLIYQDAFTSTEGNPNLVPEKVHAFELSTTWRLLDIKTGYSYGTDRMEGAALRGKDNKSYVLTRINIKAAHSYFTSVSASFNTQWLTSNNSASVTYERLVDDKHDFVSRTSKPQIYVYTNNKIRVRNLFSIQLLVWYLGEKYYSLYYDEDRWLLTLGIEKEFLNKALRCSLTANDIYHTTYPAGNYFVGGTNIVYERKYNTSYLRLMVTYSFGHLKSTAYKNRSTGETENSRVR